MDLIADFASPLPLYVICEMLGVPAADRPRLRKWSLDIARRLDTALAPLGSTASARAMAAHHSLAVYFRGLITERRQHPQADLLTELITAQGEGGILSESELLDVCGLLFVAGHETTVNLIGNGMLALLCHPMDLLKLHEDPEILPSAVEELLRWDSPVQRVGRVANTDAVIRRKTIPQGAVVSVILGAANRDPAQFPEPNRLDITRRDNRHLAFGWGARYCLGAALACVGAQIAIGTLLRRLPQLDLASDPPEWRNTIETRGLKQLQVTF
jgi:cytochrome P450